MMLRRGIQRSAAPAARMFSASSSSSESDPLSPEYRWSKYFKNTTAAKAVDYPSNGVQPTHDGEAFDTKHWNFLEEPVLAQVHRNLEEVRDDPLLQLYSEYVNETDPAKRHALGRQVDEHLPLNEEQRLEVAGRVRKEFVEEALTIDEAAFESDEDRQRHAKMLQELPSDEEFAKVLAKMDKDAAGQDYAKLQKSFEDLVSKKGSEVFGN